MKTLPASYRIQPFSIEFHVPGFQLEYRPGIMTFAPEPVRCEAWFQAFGDRVVAALGKRFLPVCRISDGEFKFLLGPQALGALWPWSVRVKSAVRTVFERIGLHGGFEAGGSAHGRPLYSSGRYTRSEWQRAREKYGNLLRPIAHDGILAIHLTHGQPRPFQEHYFPAFGRWLKREDLSLTLDNYVPFYFVYALLRGPRKHELLQNRRVIVVHGAKGEKREQILTGLHREGVAQVKWIEISSDRSLLDRIDCSSFAGSADLCLVGAGIGKPNILTQLKPLGIPCLDAGYAFEVWADARTACERPFMNADDVF